MKIRPCGFGSGLALHEIKRLPRNFQEAHTLPERTSSIALPSCQSLKDARIEFLFNYDIFPAYVMRFDAQWLREGRAMQLGDILLQRALVPPIGFGICLEFAVRISAIFNEPNRIGFGYETLEGHAESGVSEFYFEEKSEGLFFTIHTFSQPGHWTSRLASRFFTLPYQRWCTQKALYHVLKRFQNENLKVAATQFR